MNDAHSNRALLWSLLAGFILVSLCVLGVRTLVPPDEGRYAEMARLPSSVSPSTSAIFRSMAGFIGRPRWAM